MISIEYTRAARELILRLSEATKSGGRLYGLTFFPGPSKRLEGVENLPNLTIIDYTDSDSIFAGAQLNSPDVSERPELANANLLTTSATILFKLAVREEHGLVRMRESDPHGLLDWVALIKDTMERDRAGQIDASLCGFTSRPITISVNENAVSEVSWQVGIEVRFDLRPHYAGTRSDEAVVPDF